MSGVRDEKDVWRIFRTHNYAVLSDLYVVSNRRRFHNGVRADVNKVTNLHRVVVERASVGLVRRSIRDEQS